MECVLKGTEDLRSDPAPPFLGGLGPCLRGILLSGRHEEEQGMAVAHWLVKSEPNTYGWEQLVKERHTLWTGVRNFTARNHLAEMKTGDLVFFYHSGEGKEIVGVAKVIAEAKPDPTAKAGENWVAPELVPVKAFAVPVTLGAVKAEPNLRDIALVKLSRLSVMPIPKAAFDRILALGKTKLG